MLFLSVLGPFVANRPRVNLYDRAPGPNAVLLGSASALKIAPPSPGLQQLGDLVTKHMPAVQIHAVDVPADCLDKDYSALDLLYHTDAYSYLLDEHFHSKRESIPRTMRHLCFSSDGSHRRLVVIWNARFVSAS